MEEKTEEPGLASGKHSKKEKKRHEKEREKLKKLKKSQKKEQRKLKKTLKKLKKKKKKKSCSSSSSNSSSSSRSPAGLAQPPPAKLVRGPEEESREAVGLKLFGDVFARGKPDSELRWEYPMRDERRRSFVGIIRPKLPSSILKRFFDMVKDGAFWDQPKRPRTGELLPRKTDWMVAEKCKCTYRYGGVEVEPTPFPDWMEEVMETCMPMCGLRGRATWPNCCNMNLYEDGGMSVGWHADDEELFQGKVTDCPIVSLSLGQTRTFELRLNGSPEGSCADHTIELGNGDIATMEGLVQKHYQHRVPKEKAIGPRINLTWRWIKQHQGRCPRGR